jgi:toxin ParE1/3/4
VKYRVGFRPRAQADLFALYSYIHLQAGHKIAGEYVDRIEAACLSLGNFPHRGTRRDDIRPGIRTMGFERRATIVFRVRKTAVVIVRILYGGRDYSLALRAEKNKA